MICITAAILKALSYFFRTIQNTTPLHKVTLVLTPCKEVWGKSIFEPPHIEYVFEKRSGVHPLHYYIRQYISDLIVLPH
ncbi:MAG: hypothetical protein C6P35_18430 [Cohnella sp.]|nr:MAG: hypothetical protein C6P35_18430 [Cohnella sp.]